MTILVDNLRRGVIVHGRARNSYDLCRCSTDDRTQRGLQDLHNFVQELENAHSGMWVGEDKRGVAYWFTFKDGLPCYHLSRPKREWAVEWGAQEVDADELVKRCAWVNAEIEKSDVDY